MKFVSPLLALAVVAMAKTQVMLPLYAPLNGEGGNGINPNWQAAFDAIRSHPELHFYVVINPSNGPKNTSFPGRPWLGLGPNPGNCNQPSGSLAALEYGCNRDWSTRLNQLHNFTNVQTLGYIYTSYGNLTERSIDAIKEDIADYAKWTKAETWDANVKDGNIRINGVWFDETPVLAKYKDEYQNLTDYARQVFANRTDPGLFTLVMNPGSNPEPAFEADIYAMADAIVVRETCYTNLATAPDGDCPGKYAPFEYRNLTQNCGLPKNDALRNKTVNIVHQFHGPRPADEATLADQIKGVVGLGLHSFYVTGGTWQETTNPSANISTFTRLLSAANNLTNIPIEGNHNDTGTCLQTSIDWPN